MAAATPARIGPNVSKCSMTNWTAVRTPSNAAASTSIAFGTFSCNHGTTCVEKNVTNSARIGRSAVPIVAAASARFAFMIR